MRTELHVAAARVGLVVVVTSVLGMPATTAAADPRGLDEHDDPRPRPSGVSEDDDVEASWAEADRAAGPSRARPAPHIPPSGARVTELPEHDDFSERFPFGEAAERRRWRARAAAARAGVSVPLAAEVPDAVCADVPAADRISCPLRPSHDDDEARAPVVVESMAGGARLRYRPGAFHAGRAQRALGCQARLARAHPETGQACSFLGVATRALVFDSDSGLTVELTEASDEAATALRARVRTAFAPQRPAGVDSPRASDGVGSPGPGPPGKPRERRRFTGTR